MSTRPPRWVRTFVFTVATSPLGARIFRSILHKVDRWLIKRTSGRNAISSLLTGLDSLLLTTTGARSRRSHSVPLLYLTEEDRVILIASNWGQSRHPAWYHNLIANPLAMASLKGRSGVYNAYEAISDERDRYWSLALAMYPGFGVYQDWANDRAIPIMVLTPQ